MDDGFVLGGGRRDERRASDSAWVREAQGDASWVVLASMGERLRGLLLARPDEVMRLLVPCDDVHTFGMRHPIDIAFVADDGLVVEAHRRVVPHRRVKCSGVVAVVERFSRDAFWYGPGDVVRPAADARAMCGGDGQGGCGGRSCNGGRGGCGGGGRGCGSAVPSEGEKL